MKKDKIVLDAIKQDLLKVVNLQLSYKKTWLFDIIIPTTLFAGLLCILLHNIFICLLIILIAVFYISRYVNKYIECKNCKNAILNLSNFEELSISKETFSHIAAEEIHEPYTYRPRRRNRVRVHPSVPVYYFNGSTAWQAPRVNNHYSWSTEFSFSPQGLDNISLAGDEFYFVEMQNYPDISYIYPCKYFELDTNL